MAATTDIVSAIVTRDPAKPVGSPVGDLLVQPASAHRTRRHYQRIVFEIANWDEFGEAPLRAAQCP